MDMASIAGVVSSLSALKDIAQSMIGLRDGQAFQAKLLEFQTGLLAANGSALTAQQEHFSLLAMVRRLEEEVAALKAWEAEKQRYELADVGRGVMARRLKQTMANGEPIHCICAFIRFS